jgi:hypothetical protein
MKAWAIAASAAFLAALAGCNQGGGNAANGASNAVGNASGGKDGAGNSAAANPGAEATGGKDGAAAPAASGAVNLDRTFLVGRWSDDGNCDDVIVFNQDGSFVTDNGNGGGLWNLDGDRLTMTGRATATIRLAPIDQNTMTVINADGSLGRSTRC